MTTLPESLGALSKLQQLNLQYCSGLTALPESLGALSGLLLLDLGWCSGLTMLPESLGALSGLQQLNFGVLQRADRAAGVIGGAVRVAAAPLE